MINYEQWCRLKQLAERDRLSAAQISRALGLAARTVRKWLTEPYRPRKRIERASVLDPFKGQIMGMLKEHPYSAHILHLSFSESDKCFTVPLFGKNERSTKK